MTTFHVTVSNELQPLFRYQWRGEASDPVAAQHEALSHAFQLFGYGRWVAGVAEPVPPTPKEYPCPFRFLLCLT